MKFAKKAIEDALKVQTVGRAMKTYRESCDIVEKSSRDYPTVEICMLQKFMVTYLVKQAQPTVLF